MYNFTQEELSQMSENTRAEIEKQMQAYAEDQKKPIVAQFFISPTEPKAEIVEWWSQKIVAFSAQVGLLQRLAIKSFTLMDARRKLFQGPGAQ